MSYRFAHKRSAYQEMGYGATSVCIESSDKCMLTIIYVSCLSYHPHKLACSQLGSNEPRELYPHNK